MKDKFENYLQENRGGLDTHEPARQQIWLGIDSALAHQKSSRSILLWRAAALLLAFISVAQLTFIITSEKRNAQHLAKLERPEGAFSQLEANYMAELTTLKERVASKDIDYNRYAMIMEELAFVEEVESEFKEEIPLANNREQLANILIDTYEKKILLLERLLQQVERDEQEDQAMKKGIMPLKNTYNTHSL